MPVSQSLSPKARAEIAAISARHLAHIEAMDRRFAEMTPMVERRGREIRESYKRGPRIRAAIERDETFIARKEAQRTAGEEVTT